MANTGVDKDWLQRLKNESWEAELLVSAIAIFGTLQLFALIDWTTARFFDFLHPSQYSFGYMIAFLNNCKAPLGRVPRFHHHRVLNTCY